MTDDNEARALSLTEAARRIYRGLEMSAEIMRDPRRTGGWEGSERTASAFDRQARAAKLLHDRLAYAAQQPVEELHGLGPHATVLEDNGDGGFMPVTVLVGSNTYIKQAGRLIVVTRDVAKRLAGALAPTEPPVAAADVVAEREACAKVADVLADDATLDGGERHGAHLSAFAIRARSTRDTASNASTFKRGDRVEKVSGSSWQGVIVGEYSTSLTPEGYAVESEREPGSVQIYPAKALRAANASGDGA